MRNIWLVVKHDIGTTLRQRSFWIFTVLVPILLLAVNVYQIVRGEELRDNRSAASELGQSSANAADLPSVGLVDQAGLIAEMPPDLPPDQFVRFPDQISALAALEAEEVEQVVYLPADYLTSGQITVFDQNFQILATGEEMGVGFASNRAWVLPYVINYNLVEDKQLLRALRDPVPSSLAEAHTLRPPAGGEVQDQKLAGLVANIMPFVYYFLLVMGSNYLMRSVVAEKENRTAEVLLLSLEPRELMVGKMLAMSAVMWLQVIVWVGGGMLMLSRGAGMLSIPSFTFPPGFLAWALLFLVLGYLLYASIMAAAGAIAPNAREAGQVTWLLILPLMPTLMFGSAFLEDPNGTLSVALSLFPFSAPSAMVTRLAVAEVPLWQILLSLAGLALTAYLFITLAARFFRAGNLLSNESFNWRRLATGWRKAG